MWWVKGVVVYISRLWVGGGGVWGGGGCFFFNDTATTEIYTLSLHDALPISLVQRGAGAVMCRHHLSPLVNKAKGGGGLRWEGERYLTQ